MNWRLLILLTPAGLCNTVPALAAGEPRVQWVDASVPARACLDRGAIQRAVSQAIGRELFVEQGPDLLLHSKERAEPPSVALWLTDDRGHALGVRQLAATNCDKLTKTTTLVLSLMLDFDEVELRQKLRAAKENTAEATKPEDDAAEATKPESPKPLTSLPKQPDSEARSQNTLPIVGASVALQLLLCSGLAPMATTGLGVTTALLLAGGWQRAYQTRVSSAMLPPGSPRTPASARPYSAVAKSSPVETARTTTKTACATPTTPTAGEPATTTKLNSVPRESALTAPVSSIPIAA